MGAGLYIVWPAFYTDVTDAYRLGKGGRLRTDLGGVYFNVIFILITAGVYGLTGYEPLLLIIPFQHLEIMHQFLPFIRLDGYYIVSDLTGVPDMFARIKPTLASFIPWTKTSERVTELKPWVRGAVTAYVLTVVPLLLFMFTMMLINAPRIFSTAYDSFFAQYHKVQHAFNGGSALHGVIGILQMLILILPAIGIVATFWMLMKRVTKGVWSHTEQQPAARGAYMLGTAAVAALLGYIWWPNGEYRPIQPGERGTVQGAIQQLSAVPSGRPALTEKRVKELGGAPLVSSQNGASTNNQNPAVTNRTTTAQTTTAQTTTAQTTTAATTTTDTSTNGTTTTTP
jgi:putative peptide zinc metalloprotease protein